MLVAGYEWVGWRNDTPGWAGEPLEMLFEFDRVRNFSAVHIHINNMFTKDVQVRQTCLLSLVGFRYQVKRKCSRFVSLKLKANV